MPLPVVAAGALSVAGRVASKITTPLILAAAGWALEQMTDGISWAYYKIGQLAARAAGTAIAQIDVPAAMEGWSWTSFGAQAIRLIDFYQLDLAVALIFAGALSRVAVKVISLGRF